jgi:hypothetical protein
MECITCNGRPTSKCHISIKYQRNAVRESRIGDRRIGADEHPRSRDQRPETRQSETQPESESNSRRDQRLQQLQYTVHFTEQSAGITVIELKYQ